MPPPVAADFDVGSDIARDLLCCLDGAAACIDECDEAEDGEKAVNYLGSDARLYTQMPSTRLRT